jgi:hypothetical protein
MAFFVAAACGVCAACCAICAAVIFFGINTSFYLKNFKVFFDANLKPD